MTQLIIAGVEVVLPQNFSVTVKRENSFFTKNGEYTYDCTLRLDNPINNTLYGFLNRTNKSGQIATDRTATLIADGHVYCRGREVITRWTEDTVTIQIVSGESELNYFIGQDRKIEDLDLGSTGTIATEWTEAQTPVLRTSNYCLPTIITEGGRRLNSWGQSHVNEGNEENFHTITHLTNPAAQPYLCPLIERILGALGYNHTSDHYEPVNQLNDTLFANLFLVNTIQTRYYAKMFPGWTVKDFLTEVEKLTGCVFITDNSDPNNPKCDILLKTTYYYEARQIPLNDVVDAYDAEVADDESRQTEFTSSDVSYEIPDHRWAPLMKLPEGLLENSTIIDCNGIDAVKTAAASVEYTDKVVLRDETTGRNYIKLIRRENDSQFDHTAIVEVDQFADLDRENNESTLELKITPAPLSCLVLGSGIEIINFYKESGFTDTTSEEEEESDKDFEDIIRDFGEKDESSVDLYCAFHNGVTYNNGSYLVPVAYTDAVHAATLAHLNYNATITGLPEGSLRLQDLEDTYYQGGYQIDTRKAITFETFDPNVIDPRQVYVIRNRRFVVRDVEEIITAEGRQKMWKVTCYPITVSDEAIENLWILTRGVWDDGAAWLDDGRWNDDPS